MNIKFPYGLSNLEQIATENYVFVDKTPFIELLEQDAARLVSFLRPRRMGKSLFVSVLEYYYDIKEKDKFNKIFGNYYIGRKPTRLANAYYVLKMDFSGIDTQTYESSFQGFLKKIKAAFEKFMTKYPFFDEKTKEKIFAETSPVTCASLFFLNAEIAKLKIYLIIDEYDHCTNEILLRDLAEFKNSVSKDGYVRKFYEIVKTATQSGVVDRFFITGVSPITLDSFTSGFNIVTHLTKSNRFHDMMGFSETEVQGLLEPVLEEKSRLEEIMGDLRKYYNGYKFHTEVPNTLYNSDMVLYFLNEFQHSQKYPKQILDPNIMPDYGKIKKMFEVANLKGNLEVLEKILKDKEISCPQIFQFNFEKNFGRTEFVNFLYYMGNLTLKGENEAGVPVFKIPNFVIAELYWEYYANVLQERAEMPYEADRVQPAVTELALGNEKPFFDLVQNALEILSNRDFQKFDEKYVKMLIIAYAMQGAVFHIISERETSEGGYVDIEMYIRPNNSKKHIQYVFEVKYLAKGASKKIKELQAEAEKQLRKYLETDEILQNKEQLRAFTIVVVKDKLFMKRLDWLIK